MNDDSINPYAAPKADLLPIQNDEEMQNASGTKRFLNYLIDSFAAQGFIYAVFFIIGLLENTAMISGFIAFTEAMSWWADMLLTSCLMIIYFIIMESACGRTIGKLVTGTKVIDLRGMHPSFLTIIGRSLARMVPFEAFSFLGGDASGWHDQWSGTRVIDLRKPPIPKPRPMSQMRMPHVFRPPGAGVKVTASKDKDESVQ